MRKKELLKRLCHLEENTRALCEQMAEDRPGLSIRRIRGSTYPYYKEYPLAKVADMLLSHLHLQIEDIQPPGETFRLTQIPPKKKEGVK